MSEKIILVDDDSNILTSVSLALRSEGWSVETYNDGEQGLIALQRNNPDIAILDIKMPKLDGMEVLKKLRISSNIPVIFLTSKDDEIDEALGLRMGADDYITKPFSQKELIARIKALLRRTSYADSEVLKSGPISVDLRSMKVLIDEKEVHFGPKEFRLLKHFIMNEGRVFSRSQLLDQVWGRSVYVEERTVDVHIRRLRSNLENHNVSDLIQTVRGSGYRFSHTGDD